MLKTRLTTERADIVKNNLDKPTSDLADETDLNPPIIDLMKQVQDDPALQRDKQKAANSNAKENKPVNQFKNHVKESDRLYTAKQAAEEIGKSRSSMYWMAENDKIRGKQFWNIWIFRRKDLDEWDGNLTPPQKIARSDDYYTVSQTAKELGLTERTIRKKLRNEILEGEKRSQTWAVPKEVVENYEQ